MLEISSQIVEEIIDGVIASSEEQHRLHKMIADPTCNMFGGFRCVSKMAQEIGIRVERKRYPPPGTLAQDLHLDSYLDRESQFLGQIKALRQKNNESCGYYALFNSIQIMLARSLADTELAYAALRNLHSHPYFWTTYARWQCMLLEKARVMTAEREKEGRGLTRSGWPWTVKDVKTGVLERAFMLYLLENDPVIRRLRTDCGIGFESLPELGRGSLLHNCLQITTLHTLRSTIDDFRSHSKSHARALLIGQTNHWIAVLSAQIPPESDPSVSHETIVVDSRNNFVLNKTSEEIREVATRRLHRLNGSDPWTAMRRKLYLESLCDVQFSASLLHDGCTGARNIIDQILEMHFDTFFQSYISHTGHFFDDERSVAPDTAMQRNLLPDARGSGWLSSLVDWLSEYYPAPVIETNICGMLEKLCHAKFHIPGIVSKRLQDWRGTVERRINFCKQETSTTSPMLQRLQGTWSRIDETLDVISQAQRKQHC